MALVTSIRSYRGLRLNRVLENAAIKDLFFSIQESKYCIAYRVLSRIKHSVLGEMLALLLSGREVIFHSLPSNPMYSHDKTR